jgi:hypothetical protein
VNDDPDRGDRPQYLLGIAVVIAVCVPLYRSAWFAVPAGGFALWGLFDYLYVSRCVRRDTLRTARGECAQCGYDLRATPDRCPECGAVPPPPPPPPPA